MGLIWDISELLEFADNLQDTHDLETSLMTATQKVARVLHSYLLELTPVDTGNLRKMWSAGDNLLFQVERVEGGLEVTFINEAINKRNLSEKYPEGFKYGLAVNDGHSTASGGWVMGRFFVENSIDLTKGQLDNLIMTELRKWWKGV